MPIKRSAEEGGRPPLARGSACHRCFARKVRCSGQPDPASGMHACTSCLRTARFKGHDLSVARCAFHGDGLCSEEGGPTMTGEVYPNAGPGPTPRRKMGSRSTTQSSTSSSRSQASQSSMQTDFSFDSPALGSTISPDSSTASLKSLADAAMSTTAPSPENFQLPPPVTFQLPPMMPHYAPPMQPMQPYIPPPLSIPAYPQASTSNSLPNTPAPPSPDLVTPVAGKPQSSLGPSSILTRRAKAAPMSIAMPPNPAQAMGLSPVVSRAPSPALPAISNSAPLVPPSNWGAAPPAFGATQPPPSLAYPAAQHVPPAQPPQHLHYQQQQQHHHQQGAADPLAGALQSVLTPGTLAKLPTSSYDFSLAPDGTFPPYVSGAPATPSSSLGMNGYPGLTPAGQTSATASTAGAPQAAIPTPLRSLSLSELYPPAMTPGGGISTGYSGASAGGGHGSASGANEPRPTYAAGGNGPDFDPAQWTGSFHLASPGLTFSSSTPYWYGGGGGQGQSGGTGGAQSAGLGGGQYFARA
ncbi:hypothetical protein JCM10213_001409 [Rhodosporidiobolus nylandii]